jgi:hypothetical protein
MNLSNKHIQTNQKTAKQEVSLAIAATTPMIHTSESVCYIHSGGE